MKIEITALDLLVATDALETCLTILTPAHNADARNLEVMERVFKKLSKMKKKLGLDVEKSLKTEFTCPRCGYSEEYTTPEWIRK